ncbi:SDR family NAD(P)-dependent oxidoreductase [Pseudomonas sp. EpS/L25]|uniref:SDR family NAD(P)-dependent oxidoreductase n=1 Tax=Pseudomonas sp. EpS/L25 TaxID=1749078 RepID=UPI0009E66406|nr:SDR family NAD(P)-dependent oxidoreductase [Pseudomonas sp. EpS/L25]
MNAVDQKVVVISGGSSGIGAAAVERFARKKEFLPVIVDLNRPKDSSSHAGYFQTDVASEESVSASIAQVIEQFGRIDGLVNAAGSGGGGHAHQLELAEWQRIIDLNLTGTFLMSKHCLKAMMKRRHGSICNVSSVVGLQALTGATQYSASKAGVLGLTRTIAVDYALLGIRANAICPGYVDTEGVSHLNSPELQWLRDEIASFAPTRRIGRPDEIAAVIEFLISDDSSIVTGSTMTCDGGWTAGRHAGNILESDGEY